MQLYSFWSKCDAPNFKFSELARERIIIFLTDISDLSNF